MTQLGRSTETTDAHKHETSSRVGQGDRDKERNRERDKGTASVRPEIGFTPRARNGGVPESEQKTSERNHGEDNPAHARQAKCRQEAAPSSHVLIVGIGG